MNTEELKQILQEIKDDCSERKRCVDCKFYVYDGCALHPVPEEWKLDKVGLVKSEDKG